MKLTRRTALAATASTALAGLARRLEAADSATGLKGRIHHSVCKWCYPNVPLDELARWGKEHGLGSIELLVVEDIPTVQKHGLTCAMVSGVPGGSPAG